MTKPVNSLDQFKTTSLLPASSMGFGALQLLYCLEASFPWAVSHRWEHCGLLGSSKPHYAFFSFFFWGKENVSSFPFPDYGTSNRCLILFSLRSQSGAGTKWPAKSRPRIVTVTREVGSQLGSLYKAVTEPEAIPD